MTATTPVPGIATTNVLTIVRSAIVSSSGISTAEIVAGTKLSKSRVALAIQKLKKEGTVKQGGTRQFTRYASSQDTADLAAANAKDAPPPKKKKPSAQKKKTTKKAATKAKNGTAKKAAFKGNGDSVGLNWLNEQSNVLTANIETSADSAEAISVCLRHMEKGPFREALASAFLDRVAASSRRMGVAVSAIAALKSDASGS